MSYAQLLANARFAAATRLLDDQSATLQDISRKLGYSDPTHFTRAFRRWTGYPPRNFRDFHAHQATALLAANSTGNGGA